VPVFRTTTRMERKPLKELQGYNGGAALVPEMTLQPFNLVTLLTF
jgi:hypothetical protein